jgi:hypothetical protein
VSQDSPYDHGDHARTTGIVEFGNLTYNALPREDASLATQLAALRLGLCGRIDNGANPNANPRYEQIRINPELDRPFAMAAEQKFVMEGRVHSFFLISKAIDIARDFKLFPYPNFQLKFNNHAAPWYTNGDRSISSTSIPSFCLGTFHGSCGRIWVAFPKMLDLDGQPLTNIPKALYRVICKFVQSALGPAHDANLKATRRVMQGGLQHEDMHRYQLIVPVTELVAFSSELLAQARRTGIPSLRQLLFLTEVGQFQADMVYTIGNVAAQKAVFARLAKLFKPGSLNLSGRTAHVRLMARIDLPGFTLRVNAAKHIEWLRWLIPNLSQREAENIMRQQSFSLESAADVQALAGFQWAPNPAQDGQYSAICQYVKIQHTDCCLIDDLGLPPITLGSMLPPRIQQLRTALGGVCTRMQRMLDYQDLLSPVGLRIEARLPFQLAQVAMSRLADEEVSDWVIPYRTHTWG